MCIMTSCHGANGTLTVAQLAASNEQHGLQEISVAIISQTSGKVTETAMLVGSINLVPD